MDIKIVSDSSADAINYKSNIPFESVPLKIITDEKEFVDDIKLKEPESEIINEIDFKITRNLFDINNHVHNIYYMDIAKEALPEDVYLNNEFNDFEIMYKKEIKASKETNNIVKVYYTKEDDKHFVSIKTDDLLHAIIRLY